MNHDYSKNYIKHCYLEPVYNMIIIGTS